ncbi:hypothetical protein [Mesorhizobium sp. M0767]|uniref:hypothetical protein n=1 Tax=unclassified Mesorhizobium TaxID=325217 RepID=UPI00333AE746
MDLIITGISEEGAMAGFWKISATLAAIVVGFIGYWYLLPRSPSFGMFEAVNESGTARLLLSFGATILGVICGAFYRELKALQARGITTIDNLPLFFAGMFRSTDMWLGLAGAPIVYSLLLKATDGMSLPGLLAIALENGFCCLLIVNGFIGRAELRNDPKA